MSALVSISRITMRLDFIVFYSQATFWTLFLSLLRLVRIFTVIKTGVVCLLQLVYEVKWMPNNPLPLYRLYRLYRVYRQILFGKHAPVICSSLLYVRIREIVVSKILQSRGFFSLVRFSEPAVPSVPSLPRKVAFLSTTKNQAQRRKLDIAHLTNNRSTPAVQL